VTANVRVLVTIEISNCGSWGDDCSIGQMKKQAADHAIGVANMLTRETKVSGVKLVGEPKVKAIYVE